MQAGGSMPAEQSTPAGAAHGAESAPKRSAACPADIMPAAKKPCSRLAQPAEHAPHGQRPASDGPSGACGLMEGGPAAKRPETAAARPASTASGSQVHAKAQLKGYPAPKVVLQAHQGLCISMSSFLECNMGTSDTDATALQCS